MKCMRCGYCCTNYDVMIVDDPKIGYEMSNVKYKPGGQKCQHLKGDKPGEYSCGIHGKPWYKETPCYDFTQIEQSPDDHCRMGDFVLGGANAHPI